jgi:hypothetical protein
MDFLCICQSRNAAEICTSLSISSAVAKMNEANPNSKGRWVHDPHMDYPNGSPCNAPGFYGNRHYLLGLSNVK